MNFGRNLIRTFSNKKLIYKFNGRAKIFQICEKSYQNCFSTRSTISNNSLKFSNNSVIFKSAIYTIAVNKKKNN